MAYLLGAYSGNSFHNLNRGYLETDNPFGSKCLIPAFIVCLVAAPVVSILIICMMPTRHAHDVIEYRRLVRLEMRLRRKFGLAA